MTNLVNASNCNIAIKVSHSNSQDNAHGAVELIVESNVLGSLAKLKIDLRYPASVCPFQRKEVGILRTLIITMERSFILEVSHCAQFYQLLLSLHQKQSLHRPYTFCAHLQCSSGVSRFASILNLPTQALTQHRSTSRNGKLNFWSRT